MILGSRQLCRAIVATLHDREISGDVIETLVAAVTASFPNDPHVPRLANDLLQKHAKRTGRQRRTAEWKRRLALAAKYARHNRYIGLDEAAKQAARQFDVPQSSVYRAAFESKDADINRLIRETKLPPQMISGAGSPEKL